MLRQTEIIFPIHQIENNPESSETLEIKRKDFEGQNKRLYDLLMSGKRLTFLDAISNHGISDLRSRARDLSLMGILYSKEFISGTRSKVWYMTEEQIEYNKTKIT